MKAKLGPDHLYTMYSMGYLADSYGALGRYTEALKLYDQMLALGVLLLHSLRAVR
jgi:pentatricopeptide repeat protein